MDRRDYYIDRAEGLGIVALLIVLLLLCVIYLSEGCTIEKRTETKINILNTK